MLFAKRKAMIPQINLQAKIFLRAPRAATPSTKVTYQRHEYHVDGENYEIGRLHVAPY
jgi:hypothetical protein